MLVFNFGKTHNLQTRKYDVIMTSPVATNIDWWNTSLRYKRKREWVFFLKTV